MSLSPWPLPDEPSQMLLADLRIGILLIAENEAILQASEPLARILGYQNAESITGIPASALWLNENKYRDFLSNLIANNHLQSVEAQLRCNDQRVIWAEINARVMRDAQGQPAYRMAIRDITDTKQMLARLKTNEQRFRAIIENAEDGLVVLDAQEKILYTNAPFNAIAGAPSDTLQGKAFTRLLHPDEASSVKALFEKVRTSPEEHVPFSLLGFQENSHWRQIEGTADNLLESPSIQGIVLHLHDVTTHNHNKNLAESDPPTTATIDEQKRLRNVEAELRFHSDFENLIIGISARLINARYDKIYETLEYALTEVGTFEKVDCCSIFLFTPDLEEMNCVAEWHHPSIHGPARELLQSRNASGAQWWHDTLKALEPCSFSTYSEIPKNEEGFRSIMQRMEIKSLLDVPIARKGKLVGFLRLATVYAVRQWTEKEIALQKLLVEIIANALERHETEKRVNRQIQSMAALHTIDKTITSKTELRPVLGVLLEQVINQLNTDAADILLYDSRKEKITFGDGKGFRTQSPTSSADHLSQPILQEIVHQQRLRIITVPRQWQKLKSDEGFITYIGVPLIAHNEVKGILELYHRNPIATTDDWMLSLNMLSEQAAIAIDSVTMFQTLERSNRELSQAYDVTLEGWARALELRDQETEGHSRRVPWLALRLAKEIGLSEEELVHLRRGALLHDIGKMGVPDSILSKTGPLNDDEWAVMRQHPVLAYNLLSSIPFLKLALDIPYCHHEKWDGTGYPRGLKGEQIPIAARIFAIVDVWDALRTARRYRPAWEEPRVRAYMVEQSGKHFDPAIVQAFMRLLEQGTRTFA